jgi:hypothetical protein
MRSSLFLMLVVAIAGSCAKVHPGSEDTAATTSIEASDGGGGAKSCSTSADCPGPQHDCLQPEACQGQRTEYVCERQHCRERAMDNDSGCDGELRNPCGASVDLVCTKDASQPEQVECPTTCADDDGGCDPGRVCWGSGCLLQCDSSEDCATVSAMHPDWYSCTTLPDRPGVKACLSL